VKGVVDHSSKLSQCCDIHLALLCFSSLLALPSSATGSGRAQSLTFHFHLFIFSLLCKRCAPALPPRRAGVLIFPDRSERLSSTTPRVSSVENAPSCKADWCCHKSAKRFCATPWFWHIITLFTNSLLYVQLRVHQLFTSIAHFWHIITLSANLLLYVQLLVNQLFLLPQAPPYINRPILTYNNIFSKFVIICTTLHLTIDFDI